MGLFRNIRWVYLSKLSITECVNALLKEPQIYGDNPFFPERYECTLCSEESLYVIFKGGKFRRTDYLAVFHEDVNNTRITLEFKHELLGFPPMTSVYELDRFMKEKIQAHRE